MLKDSTFFNQKRLNIKLQKFKNIFFTKKEFNDYTQVI